VTPAGELTVLDTFDAGSFCSDATVGVLAMDERRRQFLYYFGRHDGDARMGALKVGGHLVQTARPPPDALPPEVLEAIPSRDRVTPNSGRHS
jgi:hypothetical protein